MPHDFQTLFGPTPNGTFDVTMTDITATQIQEVPPAVHPPLLQPATIIHINQAFKIDVQWDVNGMSWAWISGTWHLHAYLEHMGVGSDYDLTDLADHLIPFQFANPAPLPPAPPVHYHRTFDVPAGFVGQEGAYKLVVTLTYINNAGQPDQMAGYWEGPILQFYP